MMSQDNISANQDKKDENQGSVGRKNGSARPPEQSLKCPRCDSPNTKFCYYNNYSLTQPRHFCKTCRRYWTKGGALRNVPIGGGCRKNKKVRSSSSRLSGDSRDTSGSSDMAVGGLNLKFFHGISPAMDFQLGGLSMSSSSFPRLHHHASTSGIYNNNNNQFSFGDHVISATSGPSLNLDPYNFPPLSSSAAAGGGFSAAIQEMGAMNVHGNLASSIESLSSINQDLHWKLQQQRLAMLFGEESQKDSSVSSVPIETHIQKPQPILFQNLEISKPDVVCSGINNNSRKEGASCDHHQPSTEWFFGNSYAPVTATSNLNNSSSNGNNDNTSNWNGVQAWGTTSADLHHQFSALP